MNEKVIEIQKLYGQYVELGLVGLAYLAWVGMEARVRVEMVGGKDGG